MRNKNNIIQLSELKTATPLAVFCIVLCLMSLMFNKYISFTQSVNKLVSQ